MTFLISRLISSIVAIYGLTNPALSISLPLSNDSATATPQPTNLTFAPWPPAPFFVPISNTDYHIGVVIATPWTARPAMDLPQLLAFITAFSDNLKRQYPPPGNAPRSAYSTEIDLTSYTKWRVESYDGQFSSRVPSSLVLGALDEYLALLRRCGPASLAGFVYKGDRHPRPWVDLAVNLHIDRLEGGGEVAGGMAVGGGLGAVETGTVETY